MVRGYLEPCESFASPTSKQSPRPCNPAMPPSPGREPSCLLAPQKLPKSFYYFFESEFGSIPKNGGLNPWSFQFLGYHRLGPRTKLPPPPPLKPVAGSASVLLRLFEAIKRDYGRTTLRSALGYVALIKKREQSSLDLDFLLTFKTYDIFSKLFRFKLHKKSLHSMLY